MLVGFSMIFDISCRSPLLTADTKKVWMIIKAASFTNNEASTTELETGPGRCRKETRKK